MGIRGLLGIRGARDKPKNSYGGAEYSFVFGRSSSGKPVNERTAMRTTAVYSCVRILSEAIASLPIHMYRYTDSGKTKVYDHPLFLLLHDEPNPEMTSFVFRETRMSHLLIWGNTYAQIIRDGAGIYRLKFQRDIYKDLRLLEKSIGNGEEAHSNRGVFPGFL